ncbi:hypothetical protein ES708_12764 [subsurface metagenome]
MPRVNLSLKEIYAKLCPSCQGKVRDLVKDKLTDQAIEQSLEGEKPRKGGK